MKLDSNHHPTSELIDPASGDPLSEVLETIRLQSAFFFIWQPRWPFATGVPNGSKFSHLLSSAADQVISYHIVLDGPCWGCIDGEEPVELNTGDILLLPRGDAYVIGNNPRSPSPEDEQPALEFFGLLAAGKLPAVIEDGGKGPKTSRLICGFLGCNLRPFNPLLNTLPPMIRIPALTNSGDPLSGLIKFALSESNQPQQGSRTVLSRLSELMFMEVIRRYLRLQDNAPGWLGGLRDPIVGSALLCLHRQLSHAWTLESLAKEIGSSRSTLAERFNTVVGMPPMQYLTEWRMQVAAKKLSEGNHKNFTIAQEIGYESEAAFSRAFKRVVGMSPAQWRNRTIEKSAS